MLHASVNFSKLAKPRIDSHFAIVVRIVYKYNFSLAKNNYRRVAVDAYLFYFSFGTNVTQKYIYKTNTCFS